MVAGEGPADAECLRIYVSSFWDQSFKDSIFTALFEKAHDDLLHNLQVLPKQATVRNVNELCKRDRLARTNAYIAVNLREQRPTFGKDKKAEMLNYLNGIFNAVLHRYNLSSGDFPPINVYKDKLQEIDFSKSPKLDQKLLALIDNIIGKDVPMLLKKYPVEDEMTTQRTRLRGEQLRAVH